MVDNQLPRPVLDATKHLRISPNLQTVGLFRKTPSITLLEVLKNAYESNLQVDLSEWPDNVILAGSLLKTFLRNLRYPLFPSSIYEDIKKCPTDNEDEAVRYIKDILLSKVGQEHPDGELAVKLLEELLRLSKDVALHRGKPSRHTSLENLKTADRCVGRYQSNGQSQSSCCLLTSPSSFSGHSTRCTDVHNAKEADIR